MTAPPRYAPGLRRLPLPTIDPPYDDELGVLRTPPQARLRQPGTSAPIQGTLTLPIEGERLTPAAQAVASPSAGIVRPLPSPATALPDPRRWCARVAQALVEILYGKRPVQQLLNWTSRSVYHLLASHVAASARATPVAAPSVRSVRLCEVNGEVVEACAVLQAGARARALAFRLEADGTRWVCTALELV